MTKIQAPITILCQVFECEVDDLVFMIESDPDLVKIVKAMILYADSNVAQVYEDHAQQLQERQEDIDYYESLKQQHHNT